MSVIAIDRYVHQGRSPSTTKFATMVLLIVLRGKAQGAVEVGYFRADAVANSVGDYGGRRRLKANQVTVPGVVIVGGVDDLLLSGSFSTPTPPESAEGQQAKNLPPIADRRRGGRRGGR